METTDVTKQGTKTVKFSDSEFKTLVSQAECSRGPLNVNLMFAVGFVSSPVESDKLVVSRIGEELYAVGGNCEKLIESLGIEGGERAILSTDASGTLKSITVWKNDGSVSTSNDNGSIVLNANGDLVCNGGTEAAIKSESLNMWLKTSFSCSTAFGPSGPCIVDIPDNCKNEKVLV